MWQSTHLAHRRHSVRLVFLSWVQEHVACLCEFPWTLIEMEIPTTFSLPLPWFFMRVRGVGISLEGRLRGLPTGGSNIWGFINTGTTSLPHLSGRRTGQVGILPLLLAEAVCGFGDRFLWGDEWSNCALGIEKIPDRGDVYNGNNPEIEDFTKSTNRIINSSFPLMVPWALVSLRSGSWHDVRV